MLIEDLLSLDLDTEVELFEVSNLGGSFATPDESVRFRFTGHSGVAFGGKAYIPLPCKLEGIEYTSEGSLPRPKLTVSDVNFLISGLIATYDGIEGSRIRIIKTLRRYLDGQEDADSTAKKPDDVFLISQVTQMVPGKYIELELCADFDFVDESLPRRLCSRTCAWVYRGKECGYNGEKGMFTINNQSTTNPDLDVCNKGITACEKRFGKGNVLPYGGFAGLTKQG